MIQGQVDLEIWFVKVLAYEQHAYRLNYESDNYQSSLSLRGSPEAVAASYILLSSDCNGKKLLVLVCVQ